MMSSKLSGIHGKLGGIAFRGLVGGLVLVSMAACGGQAATSTPVAPTATTAVQPTVTSAPVSTSTTAPAATSTRAATATTAASPTMAATATMEARPTMQNDTIPTAVQPDATATTAPANGGDELELGATLREWAIDLDKAEVAAGTVTITVGNTGRSQHNLAVLDGSGATLAVTPNFSSSAGPQTLIVDLEPGTYTLICSLPGHAQAGQRTTLTVK